MTADMLADRAAAAPDPVADPAQWVYRKSAVVSVPEMARKPEVTERWATADGTAAVAYAGGRLEMTFSPEVPAISYAALRDLPGDPAALAQLLADTPVPRDDDAWNPGHAFEMAVALLESYLVPPSVAASLYRALGQLPGIAVIADAADAAGRRGPAFLLAGQPGGNQLLSVSAADCRFAGVPVPRARPGPGRRDRLGRSGTRDRHGRRPGKVPVRDVPAVLHRNPGLPVRSARTNR